MNAHTTFPPDALAPLLDALAERLAPLIADKLAAPQPEIDPYETWGTKQVCDFLGIAQSTLRDRQRLPSFPKRVNLDGRPRWLASDIRAYHRGVAS